MTRKNAWSPTEDLDRTEGAVRVLLHRALAGLARLMDQHARQSPPPTERHRFEGGEPRCDGLGS